MPARKTKSFSRKEVSLPLLLTLGGLGVLTLVYASGFFSLTTASNAGSIQANDRVTVDGVNNTTQYLTSMVLHAPGTNEKVTLNYDPVLNALRIKGAVNADGLIIGNNEASVGNTILGGTNNQATEGTNTNSLIVGGESNKLNDASNSAIIGGQNNTLLNTENVAVIGSSQTTFPVGEKRENIFIVGGTGNQVKGSNVFILGEGENVAGSDMVLMGKRIKAGEKGQLFVWSDEDQDFFPQRSNAFYVNTTKGIGLNTNDPKVKFDAGQAGGVRIGKTASKVSNCSPNYAGVMAYVHVGGKSGFCGCNGQTWVPLTADPSIQAVCINMQKSPCAGPEPLNANKGATLTLPVWNPDADNGNGAFIPKSWSYTNANPKAECSYDCIIGFHPGENNPEGKHPNGACKPCSHFSNRYVAGANNGWKSAGKGNDNCDFSCIGGARYQNTSSQRACPLCSDGKHVASSSSKISGNTHYDKAWYSPDDNQWTSCRLCTNKPVNAKYTQKDVNSDNGACPWECADGYNKRGNSSCLKATWQESRQRICRTTGKWKDAYDQVTYQCKDSSGIVSDSRICDIWGKQPVDRIDEVSDASCNEPTWDTSWSCQEPNCNGKCNRDKVKVTCTKSKRDLAGNVYETMTEQQDRWCNGECDDGTCGSAAQPTKTKPTSNFCAAGSSLQGSVAINTNGWSWRCKGRHGSTSCSAPKLALESGVCNPSVNGVNVSWADATWPQSDTTLCTYGEVIDKVFNSNTDVYLNKWQWKCRGDAGSSAVSCVAHKKNKNGWACYSDTNYCQRTGDSPKKGDPISGFSNGKQWKCKNEAPVKDVYCTKCNPGYEAVVISPDSPAVCRAKTTENKPYCGGEKPVGNTYKFGKDTYTQTSSDGGKTWTPSSKTWGYVNKDSLGECEYTCLPGYQWNKDLKQCGKWISCDGSYAPNKLEAIKQGTGSFRSVGDGQKSWTYTSNKNPGACEYTCKSPFEFNEAAQQCLRTKNTPCPSSKHLKGLGYKLGVSFYLQTNDGTFSDPDLGWKPGGYISWTYTGNENPGACQYTCSPGYNRDGLVCVKQNNTQTKETPCTGSEPSGAAYKLGNKKFIQTSTNNGPWTPSDKSWAYTSNTLNLEACEYTCANNYHRENNVCLSNEKQVDCKKEGAPANAEYATIKVKVEWNGTSWNEPSRCEWNCKSGFHKEGNECKSNIQKADCGGSKPATSPSYAFGATKYEKTYQNGVWTPASKDWKYVSSSDGLNACEYTCAAGYILDNNSCVKPQCTGEAPANATLIPRDDRGLTRDTLKTLVPSNTSAKCEYICNSDFHYGSCGDASAGASLGGSSSDVPCCQKNQCIGQDPANATLIPRDDQGLTRDTLKTLVPSNTPAKCEYVCKPGYVYNSLLKKCELPTYQCIGTIPANAVLIPGDDQGLTGYTERNVVPEDTQKKCEYICNSGYTLQNGACAKQKNYHWECNKTKGHCEGGRQGKCISYGEPEELSPDNNDNPPPSSPSNSSCFLYKTHEACNREGCFWLESPSSSCSKKETFRSCEPLGGHSSCHWFTFSYICKDDQGKIVSNELCKRAFPRPVCDVQRCRIKSNLRKYGIMEAWDSLCKKASNKTECRRTIGYSVLPSGLPSSYSLCSQFCEGCFDDHGHQGCTKPLISACYRGWEWDLQVAPIDAEFQLDG